MTSDAKIGLLLGLVFIFVIAFVINGLPSLRPPITNGKAVAVGTDVDFRGVDNGAAVAGITESADQPKTGGEPTPVAVETSRTVGQDLAPSQPTPMPSTPAQPSETAVKENPRFTASLEKILKDLTPTVQNDQVSTINVDLPRPAPEPSADSGRLPVAVAPPTRRETVLTPAPEETSATIESREQLPAKPTTVASKPAVIPGSKSYVVAQGDTLPAIAKKFYGAEEGNRLVNVERIFQANQDVLKSPALVVVGQKLIIPPLPKSTSPAAPASAPTTVAPKDTPADVLPPSMFERTKTPSTPMTISEKVGSLAKRAPASTPVPEGRMYTVQEGDSLWKIAGSQLGAGSRWDEIFKLNSDVLPSQDSSLKVGMKLRLPAK